MVRSNLALPRWPTEWFADAPDTAPAVTTDPANGAPSGIMRGWTPPDWSLESSGLNAVMSAADIAGIDFSDVEKSAAGSQAYAPGQAGASGHLQLANEAGAAGEIPSSHGYFQQAAYPTLRQHYDRNRQNHPPATAAEARAAGWIKVRDWQNSYHRNGPGGEGNVKYLSRDGHQEGVYDKSGKLVNAIENQGTYNFNSPQRDPFGHFRDDVLPYWLHGNGLKDATPWNKRVFGN